MPDTSKTEKISTEGCKIYGPYLRPDGRKHVIIWNPVIDKRKTVSYPKYLLQYVHNLEFNKNDTADHIDENFKNDEINNLQVLPRTENILKSARQEHRKAKKQTFVCSTCSLMFEQFVRQVRHNQIVKNGAGPFCSRRCAGMHNQKLQKNFRKPRVAQLAEATDLRSVKFQFESEGGDHSNFPIDDDVKL